MVKNSYIPDQGDLVWLDFNPQKGREQANRRPAIVLSPKNYNQKTGLALMCPITSRAKGYPFEIIVQDNKISGVVLTDQIKNLDWQERKVSFVKKIDNLSLKEIQEKIITLIQG